MGSHRTELKIIFLNQCRIDRATRAMLGDGRPQLATKNFLLGRFQVRDHVFAVSQLF